MTPARVTHDPDTCDPVFPLFPGGGEGEGAGTEATEGVGTPAPRGAKTDSQEVIASDTGDQCRQRWLTNTLSSIGQFTWVLDMLDQYLGRVCTSLTSVMLDRLFVFLYDSVT